MDFPRLTCLRQAYGRYLRNRRRTRESMADGCEEKFDFEFFKWILFDGRDSRHRAHYQNICRVYAGKVTICRNRKDADAFVQRCRKENCTKPDASSVG